MIGMHRYPLRSRTGMNGLPLELLHKVHRLLPLSDLKNAVLVNRKWRDVGENPVLWKTSVVKVKYTEDIARLARVRKIELKSLASLDWQLFFQAVERLPEVKVIKGLWMQVDLTTVEPNQLVSVLLRLESIPIQVGTQHIAEQIATFFAQASTGDHHIKSLDLFAKNLSAEPAEELSKLVVKVEWVNLCNTKLTTEQLNNNIRDILDEGSKIKNVQLQNNDLSEVPADKLGKAINKLESATVRNTRLTTEQINSILRNFVDNESSEFQKRAVCASA